MKTAMKKLFSLMLVAVLLVGVMPFQAFAAEPVHIYVELDPGRYTIDDAFVNDHYDGPGTPTSYFVHEKGFPGDSFELGEKTTVLLVIDGFAPVEPEVCDNCGETGHATCERVFCNQHGWGDHATTDHCSFEGCGELGHDADDHCDTCGVLGCNPNNHCNDCGKVDCICSATVEIIVNNNGTGKHFEVDAGLNADAVYAFYKNHGQFDGEHGPILTLADSGTPVDATKAGKSYWLWLTKDAPVVTPPDDDDEDSDVKTACKVCGGTVKAVDVDGTTVYMCEACSMDEDACTCEDEPENTQGKVKLTLDYNYWGAADTEMYVNRHDSLLKIIGQIPAPTRDGYLFDGWTLDSRGHESIDHRDYVSSRGTTKIYAQWIEQVQVVGKGYDIKVNLNYNHKMGETLKNVAKGTTMGDALEYINTPYRHGYKFLGWYWDPNCKNDVERRDVVLKDCTIYAKWERAASEVMLKIYTNGNTESPAKIVDLYDHSHDKYISLWEVKEIVKGYYTAKDSDGLSFYGLFDFDGWKSFTHNRHHKGVKDIPVNENGDTVVYVMVHNATVYSSSSSGTADSSNPKTGDMIFTSVTVLGASASCLAVLFYLNKKRAF